MLTAELKSLVYSLQNGEWEAHHIMQAWIAIEELIDTRQRIHDMVVKTSRTIDDFDNALIRQGGET